MLAAHQIPKRRLPGPLISLLQQKGWAEWRPRSPTLASPSLRQSNEPVLLCAFDSNAKLQVGAIPGPRFLPGTLQALHVPFAVIIPFSHSQKCAEILVWLASAQRAIELLIFLLLKSKGKRSSISGLAACGKEFDKGFLRDCVLWRKLWATCMSGRVV